jgi:hypothetical protein
MMLSSMIAFMAMILAKRQSYKLICEQFTNGIIEENKLLVHQTGGKRI